MNFFKTNFDKTVEKLLVNFLSKIRYGKLIVQFPTGEEKVFVGKEEVDLFTQRKLLSKFEEIIENEYLGWKRKNIFWLDENGFVWKSVQNISPKLPQFEIIVTKKPVT